MMRLASHLARFANITFGFACAALAVSAFVHLLLFGLMGFDAKILALAASSGVLVSIPFMAIFVAYFAFIPAMVIIAFAEIVQSRSWLFHASGGGLVGLAVVALFWRASGQIAEGIDLGADAALATTPDPGYVLMLIAAGMVGGLVYWAVAGRWAGSSWPRPQAPSGPAPSTS